MPKDQMLMWGTIYWLQRRGKRILVLLVIIVLMPCFGVSQSSKFTEFHTWTDLATIYNFSDLFRYEGDYGIRGLLTDGEWTQVYFRPSVRYQVRSRVLLHGGAALFYSFFNAEKNLPEIRPWVGLRLLWPRRTANFVFSHYLRLEVRAFYLRNEDKWDMVVRGRYQLQVQPPDFSIGAAKGFYVMTSFEIFEDLGASITDTFGDRFRYNLGIGKRITRKVRTELNYLFHIIAVSEQRGDFKFDDHVVRLRFFVQFGKK